MTENANYTVDPAAGFIIRTDTLGGAEYFKNPWQAMGWALEAIDLGLMDGSEMHQFIRDLKDGSDMTSWVGEVRSRTELAKDIGTGTDVA